MNAEHHASPNRLQEGPRMVWIAVRRCAMRRCPSTHAERFNAHVAPLVHPATRGKPRRRAGKPVCVCGVEANRLKAISWGAAKREVRASSPSPPERGSAQAGGAASDADTRAGSRQATVAREASRPQGRRSLVGGVSPAPQPKARAKGSEPPPGRPAGQGRARAARHGHERRCGAFCPRVSAGGRKLRRSAQRAAGERR